MRHHIMLAVLVLAACSRPAIEASKSLVGADELPNARELSSETIMVNQSGGGRSVVGPNRDDVLTYELRPDDSLRVLHTHIESETAEERVRGEEIIEISPESADRIRRELWRVRPEILQGVEFETRPTDCPMIYDAGIEYSVVFISSTEEIGVFILPYHCADGASATSRRLIRQVISDLPASEVAASFALVDED